MAVQLHHVQDGPSSGPTVLFLGSLGSDVRMWEPQVPALADAFRLVRADLRGHHPSSVPDGPYRLDALVDDVLGLLDELEVERCHLVGLSLGGMIALRLASRAPERVDRIAVLCTATSLPPAASWRARAGLVRSAGSAAVATSVVSRWFTDAFRAGRPEVVSAMESMVASIPAEGYAGCCEAIAGADLTGDLANIVSPLLCVAGGRDPATPPARLREIADAVPGARMLELEEAAHLANVERASEVNEALREHLTDRS